MRLDFFETLNKRLIFLVAIFRNFTMLAVILNYYINYLNIFIMEETSLAQFSHISIIIGCVLLVALAILLTIYFNKALRIQKKAKRLYDIACDFAKDIKYGRLELYYCYKGKTFITDVDGNEFLKAYYVDGRGQPFDILPDISPKILMCGLTPFSYTPSDAYRVAIDNVSIGDNGKPVLYLKPANKVISQWIVTKVDATTLYLKHQLMGELCLPYDSKRIFQPGERVKLCSRVKKAENNYYLTYSFY